jgi:hypothetical protein
MDRREAAKHVQDARAMQKLGRLGEARRILAEVLKDRSGYPPGLAAMAELELERGQATAAVRWARLAVRARPSSIESRELLRRARAAANTHSEGISQAPAFVRR